MLNYPMPTTLFSMRPEGSLNRLRIDSFTLPTLDPFHGQPNITALTLASRQALIGLLTHQGHPVKNDLREFLTHYDNRRPQDQSILDQYAARLATIIQTARHYRPWQQGNAYQKTLAHHWLSIDTLVIAGGLSSFQFGIHLASKIEEHINDLAVISSPWAGQTALYGMAQKVAVRAPIVVIDFGATSVKYGIATRFGNRVDHISEIPVAPFKREGIIQPDQFQEILALIQQKLSARLPVAISLACYMHNGQPFQYTSGIYYKLQPHGQHLATTLNDQWLPTAGFGKLVLLEHDSTAAALAFKFATPAIMVTLGTGLGSAPCPLA